MPFQPDRRSLIRSAAALALAGPALASPAAATPTPEPEGRKGDFDFLTGEWRIHNRFREQDKWIEFPGEATVHRILDGAVSVEELRIPARNFGGMGLRLLDIEKHIWNDHWVNAKSGVVAVPGQQGVFVDGVGTFTSEDMDGETKVIYRGVWDRITPNSCRWHQGASRDGGKSWNESWFMDWTRV